MSCNYRIGNGVDVHPLVSGRKLILGGIHINHDYGCDGHSDGDVLIHSIIDALLGALGQGDLGDYFPSSNDKYKNADSLDLLHQIYNTYFSLDNTLEWSIINIDSTIILQTPIIKPYIVEIKNILSTYLSILTKHISII